jgi:lipid II:glycine glycyltransferase (peptidoglycan interpeptide bridge formation enzyme)
MGPIGHADLDVASFLESLDSLALAERLDMIELEGRLLDDAAMIKAGYHHSPSNTFVLALPNDPADLWRMLDSTARNRIRKASQSGLTVEDTDDISVADIFYEQYCHILRRKGLVPPYPSTRPRLLFEHLRPAGMLYALRVRDPQGTVLATGLFPHDTRTMYFWGGASWTDTRNLCPNEFLHWHAMKMAVAANLTHYDMCGTGQFKRKFGGTFVNLKRWHKFYSLTARWARPAYAAYRQSALRLKGWWQQTTPAPTFGHALRDS